MATKKQKREAALAKRQKFEESTKRAGLEAQAADHAERERRAVESRKKMSERLARQYGSRSAAALSRMGYDVINRGTNGVAADAD